MAKSKEIVCVYQDCALCGDKGKKTLQIINSKGFNVRKVSFASEEGKELIHEALFNHKIGTMPFYTDGDKFSTDINELFAKPAKKTTKKAKKTKEADNGSDK